MGYFDVDVPEPAVAREPDEDVAYGLFRQKLLDKDDEALKVLEGQSWLSSNK